MRRRSRLRAAMFRCALLALVRITVSLVVGSRGAGDQARRVQVGGEGLVRG